MLLAASIDKMCDVVNVNWRVSEKRLVAIQSCVRLWRVAVEAEPTLGDKRTC